MAKTRSKQNTHVDLCIIGAGAAGMAAAISAKEQAPDLRVLLLEKNGEVGKKVRATGNGRCNISNDAARDSEVALRFLQKQGIVMRHYPNGLVYPYSESAQDVVETLKDRIQALGCEVMLNTEVRSVSRDGVFLIQGEHRGADKIQEDITIQAETLLIATGGKAGSQFGTTGDGYKMANSLGHQTSRPVPILTPVECAGDHPELIAGIRARGTVHLYKRGQEIFHEEGEIQFTKFGLSGICVFNTTRKMVFEPGDKISDFTIGVDLCDDGNIEVMLRAKRDAARQAASPELACTIVRTVLKEKLAAYVTARAGIEAKRKLASLTDAELAAINEVLHDLRFQPTGLKGWKEAQCTAGGVLLEEIDGETMESKIVDGLYLAGEVTDYDGPCGGYNLNYAWLTGMAAGRAAADRADRLDRTKR